MKPGFGVDHYEADRNVTFETDFHFQPGLSQVDPVIVGVSHSFSVETRWTYERDGDGTRRMLA